MDYAMLKSLFTAHPASVDETYTEHMAMAASFSARLFIGSLACCVHALFPFQCVKTGSSIIADLNERMATHRRCQPEGRLVAEASRKAA